MKRSRLFYISCAVLAIAAIALLGRCIVTSQKNQTLSESEDNIENNSSPELESAQILIEAVQEDVSVDPVTYVVLPENPRPGEPVTIGVSTNEKEALLFVNERQLAKAAFFSVFDENGIYLFKAAILAIPSTARSGEAIIRLINESNAALDIPVTIAPRSFVSEVIELNPVNTSIRTDPNPQRDREANILWNILTTTGSQVYHTGPFVLPVTSTRRTSFFGDRRVYQYSNGRSDTSIHAGVDFGVPMRTEVFACGAGKVILARMRISTGNSVVIEHAPGVYSLYYHMDIIIAKENTVVKTGELIGLSGSTGISTGPHLHWELRVSSENTDPDAFTTRPIIDKDEILSRIR